jgi:hypothetical protein
MIIMHYENQPLTAENLNDKKKENKNYLVISYLTLRTLIGALGIALPVALVIGSWIKGSDEGILPSISCYYHSSMRDLFVGILCGVAIFLFAYRGYDRRDLIAGNLGGLFALGVAFLPTTDCVAAPTAWQKILGNLHLLSATLFFSVLIFFSLYLFTLSDKPKSQLRKAKENRNRAYVVCGIIMLVSIILIGLYFFVLKKFITGLEGIHPVFWLETIALWAFGFSWLTKGEVLWKDNR